MTKAPAFQFYANDFMDITRMWDANAVGLHVRCMCVAWTHGSIPSDPKALARAIHCDLAELQACWNVLLRHWIDNGEGGLVHPPQEAVRQEQNELRAKRKAAAERRRGNANTNANAHAKRKQRKYEDEDEDRSMKIEDEEEETREKKSFNPKPEPPTLPFTSEAFLAAWTRWETGRREGRKPITPAARLMQLAKCAQWGEARAIAALDHSAANGYRERIEELLNDDFKYRDEWEGRTIDRLEGASPIERKEIIDEAHQLVWLLNHLKNRVRKLDYLLAYDHGIESYLKTMRAERERKCPDLRTPNTTENR